MLFRQFSPEGPFVKRYAVIDAVSTIVEDICDIAKLIERLPKPVLRCSIAAATTAVVASGLKLVPTATVAVSPVTVRSAPRSRYPTCRCPSPLWQGIRNWKQLAFSGNDFQHRSGIDSTGTDP
jgi:hypothetical protein